MNCPVGLCPSLTTRVSYSAMFGMTMSLFLYFLPMLQLSVSQTQVLSAPLKYVL